MKQEIEKTDYAALLVEIKLRVRNAQYAALKAVNRELVGLYWDIGKTIVERQTGETWGKSVVKNLAKDLQTEFPGIKGFSAQNLWYMRQFYLTYKDNEKLQPMVGEIGWAHNILIFSKCKDDLEREFYVRMTRKYGWTKNVLALRIDNRDYEKTLLGQTNFDSAVPEELCAEAKLAVKDEYLFDFLDLGDEFSERELEREIVGKIEKFLREMGGMFAFLGSQYRLEVDGEEFLIDLLFYHRVLRSLVAVELKIGKFEPEFVGKMQFYLVALDETVRLPDENPSIGLILCRTKTKTIVEYALRTANAPVGVAQYRIVSDLPAEYAGQLPQPEEIAKLLEIIE
ncbi:MAG: PDDEXK nuclease domain-containing protein [Pyrinomonadaceae bacterium]